MIEHSLRVLEYYRLLDILSSYAASPLGRSHCLALKPLNEFESVQAEQRLVSEMKELLLVKGFISLGTLTDLKPILRKAEKAGAHLEPKELLRIQNLLKVSHQVKSWIQGARDLCPSVADIVENIPSCSDLLGEIQKSVTEDGGISDLASPSLGALRAQRVALRRAVEKKLDSLLRGLDFSEESLISVRDGRYVVSVRTDRKSSLKGIVHGYSQTHSTCFVEPLAAVEENNRLVELADKEREEERRVLASLTRLVSDVVPEILACLKIMGRVDGLFAQAEFSRDINGISPILSENRTVYLLDALNPILLALFLGSSAGKDAEEVEHVVPITISMDADKSILIISGPNRGGKTVALKTIGLLALMAQSGMHIPAAEGSRLGVFDNILAEIGDEQDIAAGLSTFSARMEHLKEIVAYATESSLVILDELGTGTDPEEGASLAMATLDYLSERGSMTAISTHLQKLKGYGLINKNAQNASVGFDQQKGRPTFRLLSGMPGVSHGIEIARDIGLMPAIVDRALAYLGDEQGSSESLMRDLARMLEEVKREKDAVTSAKREHLESKRRLDEERHLLGEKMDAVLNEKRTEAERALAEARTEFGKAVEMVREKGPAGQARATDRYLKAKGDLIEAMRDFRGTEWSLQDVPLSPGQAVYHKGSKKSGIILSVEENSSRARIKVGNVKLSVDLSELIPDTGPSVDRQGEREGERQWSISSSVTAQKDLNLIGFTVADALPLVDKMIDQALVHGYSKVKIIHGIGSGTLRNAIREHLRENLQVKDLSPGGRDGVNDGVTVVEL